MAKWWPFGGTKPTEQRAVTTDPFMAEWMTGTAGGGNSYQSDVKAGYKGNPTGYGAIRMIADNASRIPLIVYEQRGKDSVELGASHVAQRTLDRPNAVYNRVRFLQGLFTDLMLNGNYYVNDANSGIQAFPHNLYRLRPDKVTGKLNAANTTIVAYEYKVDNSGTPIIYPAENVMHGWFVDPLDDTKGFGPLSVCSSAVALSNDARTWNASLMANKGAASNIISIKADLSPEQEKAIKASFDKKYAGPDKAGSNIVIPNAENVNVQPLSLTPADVHWVEGLKITLRDMSTALFVPSVLLNDTENNTYSNYQAAVRIFYTMTVLPLLDMVCDDLTTFFQPRFGDNILVAYDADNIPALEPTREEKWQQVQNAEWLTINEKREHLGWGRLEEADADKIWLPATMVPMGEDLPDFADNEEGRGGNAPVQTRAATKDERAWLANERNRVPFYKAATRKVADAFRGELRYLEAELLEGSAGNANERLDRAIDENRRTWEQTYRALYTGVAGKFAELTFDKLTGGTRSRADGDPWDTAVTEYLDRNTATKVQQVSDTTKAQIREALREGIDAGEHVRDLAKRLDALYLEQIIPNRSKVIARTEVIAASNLGNQAAANASGIPLKKKWLSTPDPRTRRSHSAAGAREPIPMNEPYYIGGYALMFPGDSSLGAGAEEVCNCRCTEIYETQAYGVLK